MKIECTVDMLRKAVGDVLPAASGRSPLPILKHVLLRVADGAASTEATDLEMFIRRGFDTDGCADGEAMADARLLAALLAKLPGGDSVSIESADKGGVVLKSGGRKYALAGLDPKDFVRFPLSADDAVCLELSGTTLGRMIGEVEHAASIDDARRNLVSVYFCGDTGTLRAVATDTHRLAVSTSDIECGPIKAILPIGFARTVAGAFGKTADLVRVLIDRNSASFSCGDLTMHGRLVEGQYPNYLRVIPSQFNSEVVFNRQELLGATARACLVTEDLSKKLCLDIGPEGIRLFVPGLQTANEEIGVLAFSGDPQEVACDGRYLTQCLSAYDGETVRLRLIADLKPWLFDRGADDAAAQFTVLMPIKRT